MDNLGYLYAPMQHSSATIYQQQYNLNDLMTIRLNNNLVNNANIVLQNHHSMTNILQPMNQNYNQNTKLDVKKSRNKKFKRYDNIKCIVCGDVSSGFHYGVYSCEACKLFFIRAEKHKREFNQCINGNCFVSIEKRKTCGSCRYKACIASGMNINRRKFGRHTAEMLNTINNREHEPNMQLKLIQQYNEFNMEITQYLTSKTISQATQQPQTEQQESLLNQILSGFYLKSIDTLNIQDVPEFEHMPYTTVEDLNIINTMLLTMYLTLRNYGSNGVQTMYNKDDILLFKLSAEFKRLITHTLDQLNGNELTIKMRVIIFIHLINSIYSNQLDFVYHLQSTKRRNRIIDSIKSEFMLFKTSSSLNEQQQSESIDMWFNMFLLQLSEMEILQNVYFNLIKMNLNSE